MLLAAFLSVLAFEVQAGGQSTPAPQSDDDRVICKRERVVGSNRPQKICMTKRERDQMRDRSREMMDRATNEQPQPLPNGM